MKENAYLPEGSLIGTEENDAYLCSPKALEAAIREERILEGQAVSCTGDSLDLVVDLGYIKGIIPRREAALEADSSAVPKDIAVITRVGRPVCFTVTEIGRYHGDTVAFLSRKSAQKMCRSEYTSKLAPGDIIDVAVTHLDPFGAFVDIGCGIVSLLSVDCISVSRISHPSVRLKKGQSLKAVVKSVDPETGRIYMTLRELLGTWDENAASYEIGSTVAGTVRSIEDYGIFVELTPNLAGLAERRSGVEVGDSCAVYVKNIIRERMKIKLSIIDAYAAVRETPPLRYFVDTETVKHISKWRYSPLVCPKTVETIFDQ
ncbi:MAG: 30S ribosomal protein S1 [Clostridia bacterium]|nr:30S ribosomal protein S1 [Clostridia bacterium]